MRLNSHTFFIRRASLSRSESHQARHGEVGVRKLACSLVEVWLTGAPGRRAAPGPSHYMDEHCS